jgi:hypothetical protein
MISVTLTPEQKEAKNEIRRARNRMWQQEIDRRKLETGCQWPGCINVIEVPSQLEFAHISQEDKEHNISDLMRYSPNDPANWEKLEAEIAKCRLLCLMHHRLETAQQGHWAWRRGIKPDRAALDQVQPHPRPPQQQRPQVSPT